MLFLSLSLAYGWEASRIPLFITAGADISARTLPLGLAAAGVFCSLLFLILPDAEEDDFVARLKGLDWSSAGLLFLLMFIYALVFNYLGFFLASFLFLNAGFFILGERRIFVMLAVSITLIVVFWLLLNYLLGVYIDPGLFLLDWLG